MWWSETDPPRRREPRRATHAPRIGLALAGALALAGCIQPMYGQFAAGGPGLKDEMQRIAIEPIPNRIGHYLGDDLVMEFNGTGSTPIPKYRLYVTLNESVQTPLIDTVSGRASSATVVVNADYKLLDIATGVPVTSGNAFVMKSYDRTSQRFSNIRAARDAEVRDAQQLADQLRIRISSALAEHGVAARY